MNKLISLYRFFKLYEKLSNMPAMLQIASDIFEFINKTKDEGRPMLTNICLVNQQNNKAISKMVDLWAATGPGNPIERLSQVIAQREELKRLLRKLQDKQELDESDLLSIKLIDIAS